MAKAKDLEHADSSRQALFETLLILAMFVVFAGGPPPDVNEAHYLGKAKHYWNPQWCAGDLFLESADTHFVFYWTFGWLTLILPLPLVAWIGRILTWLLLAWSWQRLSFAVVRQSWLSVLSAGLFLLFLQHGHMAGEWIVGGVEAKGFAYVFVFLALEAMVQNRWPVVWPLLGGASAFHVLTGGWSVLAAGIAWLLRGSDRPPLRSMLPWLLLGGVLSLPGLIPAVATTIDSERNDVLWGTYNYVFVRLAHHLVFHAMSPWFVARFACLACCYFVLVRLTRTAQQEQRLAGFVVAALLIAVVGIVIDLATIEDKTVAAQWLRFYWFRLSDAMVPLGAAMGLMGIIAANWQPQPKTAKMLMLGAAVMVVANLTGNGIRWASDFRPGADKQTLGRHWFAATSDREIQRQWRAACAWIQRETEPQAIFLTTRYQQTFKWYAHRPEVVNWKDIPQDAPAIVEWRRRLDDVFQVRYDLSRLSDAELIEVGRRYGARYALIDRTVPQTRHLVRVYPPPDSKQESIYEVYRLP